MRRTAVSLVAAAGILMAGTAGAAEDADKAEKMVKYRNSVFTVMAHNIHPLGAMLKGEMPYDPRTFAEKADRIAAVAPMALEGFGMKATADVKGTAAKAKIWDNMGDFKKKMRAMQKAAGALAAVEPGDSPASVKKATKALADTCEDCHDEYKKED